MKLILYHNKKDMPKEYEHISHDDLIKVANGHCPNLKTRKNKITVLEWIIRATTVEDDWSKSAVITPTLNNVDIEITPTPLRANHRPTIPGDVIVLGDEWYMLEADGMFTLFKLFLYPEY